MPARHLSEQYFISVQTFSHFLRHAKGFWHAAQILVGKFDLVYFFLLMLKDLPVFINEEFYTRHVSPQQLDELLADGWRHFGEQFFRYNLGVYRNQLRQVLPLRVRLKGFQTSKSQRRVLRKNQDLQTVFRPVEITPEKKDLFERHKRRFDHDVPDSLYNFLSFDPGRVPCKTLELCLYDDTAKLLAVSFFDVGRAAVSAVYAMFEPTETRRSLGILTMLLTIDYASRNEKTFYYPGYAYKGNSFYDYKKRFSGLETFDWRETWTHFTSDLL